MGGCTGNNYNFSADLLLLSKEYYVTIMHIRNTDIFKERNETLQKLVHEYCKDPKKIDIKDLNMCAIDFVGKSFTVGYATEKMSRQNLIAACLKLDKFCRRLDVKNLDYQTCLKSYCNFLRLVKSRGRSKRIVIPSLYEEFMWHSHMKDNVNYKKDTKRILGYVLKYDNEISQAEIQYYWDDAIRKRRSITAEKYETFDVLQKANNAKNEEPESKAKVKS